MLAEERARREAEERRRREEEEARARREAERRARREEAMRTWGSDSPWERREAAIREANAATTAHQALQKQREAEHLAWLASEAAHRAAAQRAHTEQAAGGWAERRREAMVRAAEERVPSAPWETAAAPAEAAAAAATTAAGGSAGGSVSAADVDVAGMHDIAGDQGRGAVLGTISEAADSSKWEALAVEAPAVETTNAEGAGGVEDDEAIASGEASASAEAAETPTSGDPDGAEYGEETSAHTPLEDRAAAVPSQLPGAPLDLAPKQLLRPKELGPTWVGMAFNGTSTFV